MAIVFGAYTRKVYVVCLTEATGPPKVTPSTRAIPCILLYGEVPRGVGVTNPIGADLPRIWRSFIHILFGHLNPSKFIN